MTFREMIAMTNVNQNMNKNLLIKIEGIKSRIIPYLYVEYPDRYNIETLKKMAKFKKIKGYYKMKRSKLIQALTRPSNESYFISE